MAADRPEPVDCSGVRDHHGQHAAPWAVGIDQLAADRLPRLRRRARVLSFCCTPPSPFSRVFQQGCRRDAM